MKFHPLDLCIIFVYFTVTITLGFWVSRRGSKNLNSYFLGGKELPWWLLGISNASGMFDVAGTMWLVYICFVYGLKSSWLPWLWPTFNQIFLMVYLSAWLRRSNVMTGAEWITTRFGKGTGSNLAHISVVIFALVGVVGFLAFGFKGIGKFATIFFPWKLDVLIPIGISNENLYAIILLSLTLPYVIKGGMISVVLTEFLQFSLMTIASLCVGVYALWTVSPESIQKCIPAGWDSIFFGWHLGLNWTGILDNVNTKIIEDGYSLFGILFMLMVFKGILASLAGPAPNYDMQRVLATKSPREACLMSSFVNVVLFFPRYMLIAGLTALALIHFSPVLKTMSGKPDFELILPYILNNVIPTGLVGLLMAGLLAAFMSNYAATVNAAPAYIVNDIYKRFINPEASQKKLVRISYVTSVLVVIAGSSFGCIAESINDVTLWIVTALYGGYCAANVLKWHWWRFNGFGYFAGMISGTLAAMIIPFFMNHFFPGLHAIYAFPLIFVISVIGCIWGSLATPPEEDEILMKFYSTVRPWGYWEPIQQKVLAENPDFKRNTAFRRDMFNVVVGALWQVSLAALPMYLIFGIKSGILGAITMIVVCTIILKFNWYDKLEEN